MHGFLKTHGTHIYIVKINAWILKDFVPESNLTDLYLVIP